MLNRQINPLFKARLKLWIGKTAFSTEYLTESMRQELHQFYRQNHQSMSDDEICQIFAKKWKRHSGRLKKYLPINTNGVDGGGTGDKPDSAPPPILSCDSQAGLTFSL